jgi:uncharacterized repeat protein (TIGR03803 family)
MGKRGRATVGKPNVGKGACAVVWICAVTSIALPAQTVKTIFSFNGGDGDAPSSSLVQATNGQFYGTTAINFGVVFSITPSGREEDLYSFCDPCSAGYGPADLIQATDGDLYSTTVGAGANLGGTVFRMTLDGTLTTLYSFCGNACVGKPSSPSGGLVQTLKGDFYGLSLYGGNYSASCELGCGTVFRISPSGTLSTIYSFCSQPDCADGKYPHGSLVQGANGNLYGVTGNGALVTDSCPKGCGTIFEVSPAGTLTTIYSFCEESGCPDGSNPTSGLVQAGGDFFGTTGVGGYNDNGTAFRITPSGALTTLYRFCSESACADGSGPGPPVLAADGNFYGTTGTGGTSATCPHGCGTIFMLTPSGTFTSAYSFSCPEAFPNGCPDGILPGPLLQSTNGDLYGPTYFGGTNNLGTVYSLSVGVVSFVEPQTTAGKEGSSIKILGTNLADATSVTFNGTPAAFLVPASSVITTTVPAGATTGRIEVVTPNGTLSSSVPFHVLP